MTMIFRYMNEFTNESPPNFAECPLNFAEFPSNFAEFLGLAGVDLTLEL